MSCSVAIRKKCPNNQAIAITAPSWVWKSLCLSKEAFHDLLFSPRNGTFFLGALYALGSLINRHLRNCREAFNMHQIPSLAEKVIH